MVARILVALAALSLAVAVGAVLARVNSNSAQMEPEAERDRNAQDSDLCEPLVDNRLRVRTTDVVGYVARNLAGGIEIRALDAQRCTPPSRFADWSIATRASVHSFEFAGPLSWSPSGNRIVYATRWFDVDSADSRQVTDIWVLNADGSDHRLVMSDVHLPEHAPFSSVIDWRSDDSFEIRDEVEAQPLPLGSLSPDGGRIAYNVPGFEMNQICIAPVSDGDLEPYRCIGGGGIGTPQLGSPEWSPH